MDKLDISKSIEILTLCSEVFFYPEGTYVQKVQYLGELSGSEELKSFSLPQVEIESEYLRLFSLQSEVLKTVPHASWWIDGRLMGRSYQNIVDFYKECGFAVDNNSVKVPFDYISLMLSFLCILLEDKDYRKAVQFISEYLSWTVLFQDSLEKSSKFTHYVEVAKKLNKELKKLEIL